jgi:hypothetical protein
VITPGPDKLIADVPAAAVPLWVACSYDDPERRALGSAWTGSRPGPRPLESFLEQRLTEDFTFSRSARWTEVYLGWNLD